VAGTFLFDWFICSQLSWIIYDERKYFLAVTISIRLNFASALLIDCQSTKCGFNPKTKSL